MRTLLKITASLALLAVFVGIAGRAPVATAADPEAVTMRMDWLPISYHAPFHLAKAKGYYKAAGIDPKFEEGKGSGAAIQLVANNVDTFGFADASVVAKSVGQGVPIKLILGVFRRSPVALVYPAKNAINAAADLKGKKLATCAGDAAVILLPAYLKAKNMSMQDVQIVTVDCGAKYTVVAQGLADVTVGFSPYGKTMFGAAGITGVRTLDYADAGINVPSHGIIAANATIENKPDLVKRFISATVKGWNEARQNPDVAIAAMVQAVPLMKGKEAALKTELIGYMDYLDTPATKGKPFGWQSPDDWAKARDILVQYLDIKPQPVETYFTNQFIAE